jgi:hypothetical protein
MSRPESLLSDRPGAAAVGHRRLYPRLAYGEPTSLESRRRHYLAENVAGEFAPTGFCFSIAKEKGSSDSGACLVSFQGGRLPRGQARCCYHARAEAPVLSVGFLSMRQPGRSELAHSLPTLFVASRRL